LFPNPNNGVFTIQHNFSGVLDIRITDAVGRVVMEQKITSQLQSIDMNVFAAGVYVATITGNRQLFKTLSIVKQ
jgi:hypothetical protein